MNNNVLEKPQISFATGRWGVVNPISEADLIEGYRSGILTVDMTSDGFGSDTYCIEVKSLRRERKDLNWHEHVMLGTVAIKGGEYPIGLQCHYGYSRFSKTTVRINVFDPN